MAPKEQPKRLKHQPLRTCLGCRAKRPKKDLVRVVRIPSGAIEVDPSGRRAGRGAYVCPGGDCLKAAVKGKKLERALEAPVPDEVLEALAKAVVATAPGGAFAPTGAGLAPTASGTGPSGSRDGPNPMKR